MPQATFHFPTSFLWGTATSSHQVEGSNTNNNWASWEAEPNRIHQGERSGLACNWWGGRWKEDFDRAAETGQNAHRLSLEWSRIQPTPDRWDEDALDHYRQMLRGLHQRGIQPMVTLHHCTDPLWLYEQGGWENAATPARFAAFVQKAVEALKEYASLWVTINEPNVYTWGGYLNGGFPPGKNDLNLAFKVLVNLLRGHAAAYHVIHAIQPQAQVGTAINYRWFIPARPGSPFDKIVVNSLHQSWNDGFARALVDGRLRYAFRSLAVPEAANTQDFIGVNYYAGDLVSFTPFAPNRMYHRRAYPPDAELSETGFIANMPAGMFESLRWANSFKLPIYVTENGIEDSSDALRPRYVLEHIHQIWRAVNFNYCVRGYFHWSLVDNFEWERGWSQRFGLWGLDVETQARLRRPSVDLYAAICKSNSISSEMVEKYAPQISGKLFPG
ncbi:MAG: family 1 glycosylhydrolase [Anaerolineaceae bacterium]|nr:family 1 glycosylhydrolase [Anaerolineaceae bacterium]